MTKIMVVIQGGVVTDVLSDNPEDTDLVLLLDHDEIDDIDRYEYRKEVAETLNRQF